MRDRFAARAGVPMRKQSQNVETDYGLGPGQSLKAVSVSSWPRVEMPASSQVAFGIRGMFNRRLVFAINRSRFSLKA